MSRNGTHLSPSRPAAGQRRHRGAAASALVVALVVVGVLAPAGAASAADGPGPVTVSDTNPARGSTVDVSAPGCDDVFQFLEARLVVGNRFTRRSAAIASGRGSASFVVPQWVPSGRATVEVSCTEADLSMASDGSDVLLYDYAPVAVAIPGRPPRSPVGILRVERRVNDGVLRVSGSNCTGTVGVTVARGYDLVGSRTRFHYQGQSVTPGPDGRWQMDLPLVYAVSSFRSPIPPGLMSVFAQCDGLSYRPERFVISYRSPRPSVQPQAPSSVYLGQCSPGNRQVVITRATWADGSTHITGDVAAGVEYGESFMLLSVPADATSASYWAVCIGLAGPSFTYAPASWSAAAPSAT